jgi:glycyl-tRNA synthetase beta chain
VPELLLELLSEEIPARMQAKAADDLKRLVTEGLKQARLEYADARAFATPRRLALVVEGLPKETPPDREIRKGPRVGSPQQAVEGFLRSVARPSVDDQDIKIRETEKGKFYFFEALIAAKDTSRELPTLLEDAIDALPWPKSMRWKEGQTQGWVRPLHNILAIFDGKKLDLGHNLIHTPAVLDHPSEDNIIFASNETIGHRFLAPGRFEVKGFEDYREKLEKAHVVLDAAEREKIIREQAEKRAAKEGFTLKPDDALVTENAGMVEWPVILMGKIGKSFMDLPPEVLTTAMRAHQKYFSLIDKHGKLAPRFILVSNIETKDEGAAIVAGNERVLRARLADAKFFWDQDQKESLASRAPALRRIVFHAKLGSLDEKIDRVQALAVEIAAHVPGADKDPVRSAARLCKADLTTGMVGEFPDLQGVMGRYYALHDGEKPEVADAIGEHYAPQGPRDRCPSAPVSVALALADKIDSLVGFFAIGEKPTGSKDPFALRRAALGVIRLVLENGLRLPLFPIFVKARELYGAIEERDRPFQPGDLLAFFEDRLKVHLREKGSRHDLISAVFSMGDEDDLVRLLSRVSALEAFLESDDGANLLTAYKRSSNIVRIEENRDKARYSEEPVSGRLNQEEERALFTRIIEIESVAEAALANEDFTGAMAALARLRTPVDAFFDKVTVNCDEAALRRNRLNLLSRIRKTLDRVADFSRIEG